MLGLGDDLLMIELPPLLDERVVLRAWDEDDADWYAAVVRDPEIQRFTSEPEDLTAEQVRAAIVALRGRQDQAGFVVCDAATGQRLGNIALRWAGLAGEVSYWVAAEARGRGVATAALRLLSAWALTTLGLLELRLWCHVDNRASRRVAERAGYRRAPRYDGQRVIKQQTWPIVVYVREKD
jgi:[ribosomal protein S5]-alanine N-acetyltransferase